jgi:hypothetical protein
MAQAVGRAGGVSGDDPAATIEIRYSRFAMGGLIGLGAGLTLLCGFIAVRLIPSVQPGSLQEAAGWAGLIVFSMATALTAWRTATTKGPVVTLTATGLRDIRVAEAEIPWAAITAVATVRVKRAKYLVLTVDPAVEPTLKLTRMARWARPMNRRYGIHGLAIAAQGLAISHERLKGLCEARAAG